MSKSLLLLIPALLVAGCATREPQLYRWGAFPTAQYRYLLHDGMPVDEQITTLEALSERAAAEHAELPPGFRAHLGMLYMDAGNPARARDLWQAEKATFPESAPFIDRLLRGPAEAAAGAQERRP